jgi:hypothetical protein
LCVVFAATPFLVGTLLLLLLLLLLSRIIRTVSGWLSALSSPNLLGIFIGLLLLCIFLRCADVGILHPSRLSMGIPLSIPGGVSRASSVLVFLPSFLSLWFGLYHFTLTFLSRGWFCVF